jgi:hypothetical protein
MVLNAMVNGGCEPTSIDLYVPSRNRSQFPNAVGNSDNGGNVNFFLTSALGHPD